MTITVIGAGVAGLTTALALAERGEKVVIIERSGTLGEVACSRFAGGMLAPWCEQEGADPRVLELGREAMSFWSRIYSKTATNGTLVVAGARDETDLRRFAKCTSGFVTLEDNGIAALEPALAGRFRRGLFFPQEAHLNPRAALPALAEHLARLGVPILFGRDFKTHPVEGEIIDCRGFAARDELDDLRGVKGEMLIVRNPDLELSRPVRLLHPRTPVYVVPRGEGVFMLGATVIESDDRRRISVRGMMELLGAACSLHPSFAYGEILEIGTEVRPAFSDNLPRIRRTAGRTYVNGLFRHGFLLAPAIARIAADFILNDIHHAGLTDAIDSQRCEHRDSEQDLGHRPH